MQKNRLKFNIICNYFAKIYINDQFNFYWFLSAVFFLVYQIYGGLAIYCFLFCDIFVALNKNFCTTNHKAKENLSSTKKYFRTEKNFVARFKNKFFWRVDLTSSTHRNYTFIWAFSKKFPTTNFLRNQKIFASIANYFAKTTLFIESFTTFKKYFCIT